MKLPVLGAVHLHKSRSSSLCSEIVVRFPVGRRDFNRVEWSLSSAVKQWSGYELE